MSDVASIIKNRGTSVRVCNDLWFKVYQYHTTSAITMMYILNVHVEVTGRKRTMLSFCFNWLN